jgi:hypothetical protein
MIQISKQDRSAPPAPVIMFPQRSKLHLVGSHPEVQQIPEFVFRTDLGWQDYWFRYCHLLNPAKIAATFVVYGLMYLVWLFATK